MTSQLDEWLSITRECKYLPEPDLRKLCDYVSCTPRRTRPYAQAPHALLSTPSPSLRPSPPFGVVSLIRSAATEADERGVVGAGAGAFD
jgi:hypothetical protein